MSQRFKFSIACLLSTALAACAGLDTKLPEIEKANLAAEAERQETKALQDLESDTATLLNIGWPILTANAELCPKTRSSIGVKTHILKSYPKRLRRGARRILGAEDTPRIFHIADGSPAALAGFRRGDILLNDKGEPAKLSGDKWEENLADNSVAIKRGDETLTLAVTPVLACDYNLRLTQSPAINAFADGRNITFTTGMIDFVGSDDELALIVGHELAHNTMGHIPKSIGNFILSLGGTRYTRPFESEADYVGLYYSVRAGYSPKGVESFWQRLSAVAPKSIHLAKTHPTFPERYLRIRAAQDEISTKQSAGTALLPNFKTGSELSKP
jgi:hypothetical protein